MKNIIFIIIIFILGFFSAQYFMGPEEIADQESIEAVEEEVYENSHEPIKKELQETSVKTEGEKAASVSTKKTEEEVMPSNPKIERINGQLEKLDQAISEKLKKLKKIDADYADKLQKELTAKPTEPLPGDDKFTEKEYSNAEDDGQLPSAEDLEEPQEQ